ncbi:unnamed protein product [Prunus armeniaca]|uniref:Uncharacterized protein n=1 Tax=Prunus armeniaca TaxID=36596 RepID=A0A6J5WAQ4_PRUAR|nr:unnamed protein product [Prunus armeniaca]CAB4298736.1 unnamed protein product [Prunus armeniaca]
MEVEVGSNQICDADCGWRLKWVRIRFVSTFESKDRGATQMMEVRRQRGFCDVRMGLIEVMEVVMVQINGGFSRVQVGSVRLCVFKEEELR